MLPETRRLYDELVSSLENTQQTLTRDVERFKDGDGKSAILMTVDDTLRLIKSLTEATKTIGLLAEEEIKHYLIIPYSHDKEEAN